MSAPTGATREKEKLQICLPKNADIIVRFQGGANAGHTIVNNYGKFALHTLPSGVFYSHTTSVIGNGVALNIPVLCNEIKSITDQGVPMPKILVSDRAQIVMPYHILFDQYEEERLGKASPSDPRNPVSRRSILINMRRSVIRSASFSMTNCLKEKVERTCETKNVLLEHLYHKPLLDPKELSGDAA